MEKIQAKLLIYCTVFLFILTFGNQLGTVNSKRVKSHRPLPHFCPKSCKLSEESNGCGKIINERQYENVYEVCAQHLQNDFKSGADCEKKCRRCKLSTMIGKCTRKAWKNKYAICMKKPETGPCRAYFVIWYYNSTKRDCETFVYGGCGGNENHFETQYACLRRCGLAGFLSLA